MRSTVIDKYLNGQKAMYVSRSFCFATGSESHRRIIVGHRQRCRGYCYLHCPFFIIIPGIIWVWPDLRQRRHDVHCNPPQLFIRDLFYVGSGKEIA